MTIGVLRRYWWLWLFAALALVVLASFAFQDSSDPVAGPAAIGQDVGTDVVFGGFDGGAVRLSDFRGIPLVLNYWASWCAPCLEEMPGFERVYQANRDQVAFLGVNITDDPTAARAVVELTGISYPLAVDADGSTFTVFGGLGMPTTVFIDASGRTLDVYTGTLTETALQEKIDTLFGA